MYSNKLATFETHNAAVWEKESEIGDVEEVPTTSANGVQVTPVAVQRGLSRFSPATGGDNNGGRAHGRGTNNNARGRGAIDRGSDSNGSHPGRGATRGKLRGNVRRGGHYTASTGRGKERFERTPLGGHSRDGTGLSHAPSVSHRVDQELPRRPAVRVREPGLNSSTGWAEPTPLLTDARRAQLQYERESQESTKRFLKKPLDGEVISAIGFYQWPMKEDSPEDLFREYLKDLDHLKTSWKVFIDWNGPRKWLRIRATPAFGQTAINEVIKGIRQAVESGKTRAIMATPCHIVVPPRYSTESTLLEALVKVKFNGRKYVHGLKFSKQASDEELKKQSPSRSLKVEATVKTFREELNKNLNELSHLKDWMRMRAHFGELHLTHWQTDLTDGQQTLDGFMKMMKRTRTRGTFEKGVDPLIVKYMMERVKLNPDNFKVWSGTDYVLADVKPKHVAIFTVQNSSGEMFHIEADVDKTHGGYQCGEVKVMEEERRNKCVEIVTIDIEQVDWALEIISETAGTMLDSSFQDLVQSCLQPFVHSGLNTQGLEERKDQYGFEYPRITPRGQAGLRVDKVTLQSVYRFKTRSGGYCLEFTINRDWDGLRTTPEPNISGGITMFHDQWDIDMESNEHTTADRKWEKDMSNFFPDGGFKVFIEQLNYLLDGFHQSKSKSFSTV
ncbi:fce0e70d-13b0-4d60-914a-a50e0cb76599 [Sclerotinia trifoliorum]|uniref:Fce0e70d-13b0-4d60-914a-a50e0cb76599 n=1 Tax=Sclerotinia trifoliorum TaxID=28548 RepID=A0A8H2VX21_9HELO|nr:fce0e70d-13b0-4d60-914a-a50e0cb76599 [Sclerotinia trifoliorum]